MCWCISTMWTYMIWWICIWIWIWSISLRILWQTSKSLRLCNTILNQQRKLRLINRFVLSLHSSPLFYLSVYLNLPIYIYIYISSISTSIYLSLSSRLYLPLYLSIYLSIYLPTSLPTYLPICVYIYLLMLLDLCRTNWANGWRRCMENLTKNEIIKRILSGRTCLFLFPIDTLCISLLFSLFSLSSASFLHSNSLSSLLSSPLLFSFWSHSLFYCCFHSFTYVSIHTHTLSPTLYLSVFKPSQFWSHRSIQRNTLKYFFSSLLHSHWIPHRPPSSPSLSPLPRHHITRYSTSHVFSASSYLSLSHFRSCVVILP